MLREQEKIAFIQGYSRLSIFFTSLCQSVWYCDYTLARKDSKIK